MPERIARARQTVYLYDAIPIQADAPFRSGWAPEIDGLMQQGYGFLDAVFESDGVLFRGMSNGLSSALTSKAFGGFADNGSLCELEQQLNVLFCSQDLSDAINVSRIWETVDSGILVFPSRIFVQEWEARQAAVMAFAEAGIVFKYPFMLRSLVLNEVAVVVRASGAPACCTATNVVDLPPYTSGDRQACEDAVQGIMAEYRLRPTAVRYGVDYPRMQAR